MNESLREWFVREILVHERALVRFMMRVWPDRTEIDDLCHDTYIRVYESAAKSLPASPRAFLFTTARHLMADRVRRGRIVSIEMRGDLDSLNVLIDDISPEQQLNARQELWRLTEAFAALPQSCREVMWLIKVEELSRKQISERLGITPKAVEKRIERGVQFLEQAYFGGKQAEVIGSYAHGIQTKDEPGHGQS